MCLIDDLSFHFLICTDCAILDHMGHCCVLVAKEGTDQRKFALEASCAGTEQLAADLRVERRTAGKVAM